MSGEERKVAEVGARKVSCRWIREGGCKRERGRGLHAEVGETPSEDERKSESYERTGG